MNKITLFKTLLAAVCLLGSSSAWADGKNYSQVFKYTYEDNATISSGLTIESSSATAAQYAIGTENYLMVQTAWKSGSSAYYDFASSITGITDYKFSFNFGYSPCGSSQGSEGTVLTVYDTSNAELFHFDCNATGNNSTAGTITVYNGETSLGTFAVDTRYNASPTSVYTVTVTGDDTGVSLAITKVGGSAVTLSNAKLNDSFKLAGKLHLSPRGGNGTFYARAILDDVYFGEAVTGAFADAPSFTLKAISGENRVYTLTNGNEGGTLYYTTTPAATAPAVGDAAYTSTTDASKDVTFTASGNYYAYVVLDDNTTTSDIEPVTVTTGAISLNRPTLSKTNYSGKKFTVSIASSQADIILNPTATIYYRIGDTGDFAAYSTPVAVDEGKTLYAYTQATGYTNSETVSLATGVVPVLPVSLSQNYVGVVASDQTMKQAEAEGAISNAVAATAGGQFYVYSTDGANAATDANIGFQVYYNASSPRTWMIRAGGMYNFTAGNASVAITNLKEGQIVRVERITSSYGTVGAPSGVLSEKEDISCAPIGFYEVTADGTGYLIANRGTYVKRIDIYDPSASVTVTAAGYATYYTDAALDFAAATPAGLKAYIATANDGESVTLTEVTSVPAGTGVLLKGVEGTATEYSIPALSSSSTDVTGNIFLGTATGTTVAAGAYVLYNGTAGVGFYKTTAASFTIGAKTAYLPALGGGGGANLRLVFEGEEATGISGIGAAKAEDEAVYNVAGQRVNGSYKGIVIKNGKKYLRK